VKRDAVKLLDLGGEMVTPVRDDGELEEAAVGRRVRDARRRGPGG
jgi:hypothetical protein